MADSIPGNSSSLTTLKVGASATSAIDFWGDTDWWKVDLIYGFSYQVWMEGYYEGVGTLLDPYLAIYNGNGSFAFSNDDAGWGSSYSYVTVTPTSSGYLFISAGESGNNAIGTYQVTIWPDQIATTSTAAT